MIWSMCSSRIIKRRRRRKKSCIIKYHVFYQKINLFIFLMLIKNIYGIFKIRHEKNMFSFT
jgi:hypothetical protein